MFKIIVDTTRAENWFMNMPKNIRKRGIEGVHSFGNKLVSELLLSARRRKIRPFRKARGLFTSTRFVKTKNGGYIKMPMSGVYQDRARAHYVSTSKKNPMARAWAFRYLKRPDGSIPSGFRFRGGRHFIQPAIRNAKRSLRPLMRGQVNIAIRESH